MRVWRRWVCRGLWLRWWWWWGFRFGVGGLWVCFELCFGFVDEDGGCVVVVVGCWQQCGGC